MLIRAQGRKLILFMIIIISGTTHSGKTSLAQKLLEKLNVPYLSIDHIKMGLIRSEYTNLKQIDDEELTNYLWPIIREIIKTNIEKSYTHWYTIYK